MPTEKQIQNDILRALAGKPNVRVWRANTGKAVSFDGKRVVSFGVAGQADISGICLTADGQSKRCEIEVKTPDGVQSLEQRNFQAMITKYGGIYLLVRSVDDLLAGLRKHGVNI